MEDDRTESLVLAVTVGDPMTAQLIAARLDSMGIDTRLRGEGSGPYPMTVGRLAETEIWVRESDLEDALDEIDASDTTPAASAYDLDREGGPTMRLVALVTVVVLGLAVIVSLMRVL